MKLLIGCVDSRAGSLTRQMQVVEAAVAALRNPLRAASVGGGRWVTSTFSVRKSLLLLLEASNRMTRQHSMKRRLKIAGSVPVVLKSK